MTIQTMLVFLPLVVSTPNLPPVAVLQAIHTNAPVIIPVCSYDHCQVHQRRDGLLYTSDPSVIGILRVSEKINITLANSVQSDYLPIDQSRTSPFLYGVSMPEFMDIDLVEASGTERLYYQIDK